MSETDDCSRSISIIDAPGEVIDVEENVSEQMPT